MSQPEPQMNLDQVVSYLAQLERALPDGFQVMDVTFNPFVTEYVVAQKGDVRPRYRCVVEARHLLPGFDGDHITKVGTEHARARARQIVEALGVA